MRIFYISWHIVIVIIAMYNLIHILKKNNQNLSGMVGLLFGFTIYYGIIPVIDLFNYNELKNQIRFSRYCNHIYDRVALDYILGLTMITITLFLMLMIYKAGLRRERRLFANRQIFVNSSALDHILRVVGLVSFTVGAGSFMLLLGSLGGISSALSAGEAIRQHSTELSELTKLYYLYIPAKLVEICPYIFYFLKGRSKSYKILFWISLLVTAIYFLFNAGRGPILIFAICFAYLTYTKHFKNKKFFWTTVIIGGMVMLPLLDVLDNVFLYLQDGTWRATKVNYLGYAAEFSVPYVLNLNMHSIVEQFGLTYFKTIFEDILSLLPKVNFPPSYVNTSVYISGPFWVNTGGIPNDLITFGYLQLGPFGTVIVCGIVAKILSMIDATLIRIEDERLKLFLGLLIASKVWDIVVSADFRTIIQGRYVLLLTVIIILLIRRRYLNKKHIVIKL